MSRNSSVHSGRAPDGGAAKSFRVMTYNTHGCRGRDGRVDVERVAQVIVEQDPDIVCLQELDVDDPRSAHVNQPLRLAELTQRRAHFHAARTLEGSFFGNATLCRHRFELIGEGALPSLRDEARAAHCLRVTFPSGEWVDSVNTHLSIRWRERFAQIKAILSDEAPLEHSKELFAPIIAPYERLILCGDLNAGGWSPVTRWLRGKLRDVQNVSLRSRRGTWPAAFPLLRLDHIWVGPGVAIDNVFVPRGGVCDVASDHLPLVADLSVPCQRDEPQDDTRTGAIS